MLFIEHKEERKSSKLLEPSQNYPRAYDDIKIFK